MNEEFWYRFSLLPVEEQRFYLAGLRRTIDAIHTIMAEVAVLKPKWDAVLARARATI